MVFIIWTVLIFIKLYEIILNEQCPPSINYYIYTNCPDTLPPEVFITDYDGLHN